MSLIDRIFIRFDEFRWGQAKRRSLLQPQGRTIQYRNPENSQERKGIPTFGSDSSGFGEEYAADAPSRPFTGPLPLQHKENVHGHVREDAERPVPEQEPYQDPSLSSRGSRTSESTDQKPIRQFTGEVIEWDGIVRSTPRKCFESDTGKGSKEPTFGDQAARDLRDPQKYTYDFSV